MQKKLFANFFAGRQNATTWEPAVVMDHWGARHKNKELRNGFWGILFVSSILESFGKAYEMRHSKSSVFAQRL